LGDEAGSFVVVESGKLESFRAIEGEVEVVLFLLPIDGHEHSVISRGKLHLQIQVARTRGMVYVM